MESLQTGKPLDRYLSRLDVWAMAFGCMVGWGVFAMPGTTFVPIAGPLGTLIAYAIGAVIMLIIASNFSFLMGRSSITGGVYSYTKEAFGRDHAFLCSWFLCLSYLTIVFLNGTALFLVVRTLFADAVQSGIHYTIAGNTIYLGETVVSVLVLAVVGVLFVAAKAALQRLHTVLSVVLLCGVVITAAFCLPRVFAGTDWLSFGSTGVRPGYAVFSLVILAPWAFVGFEVTSFDTAHFKFPIRKSKPVLILSILLTAFAYASMALVSIVAVPDGFDSWQTYFASLDSLQGVASVPTFYGARAVMGTAGLVVMAVTAIAAILTGIIGGYRAATRVLSTMAEDRILSDKFSKMTYSIVFIMVLSIVLSLFGRNTLNWFVDLTSFGAIIGFGYSSAAAFKLARAEGNRRVAVTGLIGAAISALFVIVQLVPRLSAMEAMGSEALLLLSLWCLLGFFFYWRTVRKSTLTEYSGMSASGVALFALLVYAAVLWLLKQLSGSVTPEELRSRLNRDGVILLVIIFVGLTVMLYVQNVVRKKHEAAERERIRAMEGSLAKSRFLFNMSHDIRTPMNAIIGYTDLAKQETDPAAVREYLEKIDGSGKHLLALINDIMEMSRIESGKIELDYVPTDLCAVFEGMRDLFSEQMRAKEIDFGVHTESVQDRFAWCDRKNLNRVLLNIINNALKFTPEGGRVVATLTETGAADDYATYEMRVQDTGIGMSKEFAERMFHAFERERTSTVSGVEGTGLGLSITKGIVDLMGGTIDVLTAPGSGTEIIIRLKLKLADASDLPEDRQAKTQAKDVQTDFTGKRVLLVEDNAINMEIAEMILSQAGFTVETAENGKIAVETVAAAAPDRFDAILMDIQMPEMDGYEATRAIRAMDDPKRANVPILAMTANAFREDVEACKAAGMQAHIAKPIDVPALLSTLASVLNKQA